MMQPTSPSPNTGVDLATAVVPVGLRRDAVRVPRHLGLAILKSLARHVGAVIVDPNERVVYFFASSAGRTTRQQTAFTSSFVRTRVLLPPADRRTPPGPYWLHSPAERPFHTPMALLQPALREAVISAYGLRPEVP